jgi:dipeptidase E
MKAIVAIGGGEMGRPGTEVETTAIDKEVLRLTGKKRPKVLFIPTASSDSTGYFDVVKKHYGDRLGADVDVLWLIKETPTKADIRKKILLADAIYVGGGNTAKMIRIWKKYGVDAILRDAWKQGVVLSGLSAGSICWFLGGTSDSRRFKDPKAGLIKVSALGFIKAYHSPHHNVEKDRRPELKRIMRRTPGVAIALDNCSALEIIDDTYRVLTSKSTARAHKTFWKAGKYYEIEIPASTQFKPLSELLSK